MNIDRLVPAVDWLCSRAVEEGLLSKENCVQVIDAIEENGLTLDAALFASVVNDNGLCAEPERLTELAGTSSQGAMMPFQSIFAETPPAPESAELPAPVATGKKTNPEIQSQGGWMEGWPVLEDAATMEAQAVKELLNRFLQRARQEHCSDVHISAGAAPYVRRFKSLYLLPGQPVLSDEASKRLNLVPLQEAQRKQFDEEWELDYSYKISEEDRYRVNILAQRLGISGAYRVIDAHVKAISELGFKRPDVIEKLTTYGQGLILITGPSNSGKTVTMNALLSHLNHTRQDHIITVEDPIEVVHYPSGCAITQRELHSNTLSFGNALRAALREDPDIIIIGEMRDLETIEMAIHSSETGHLVIGTLHTSSAADTMSRILDVFPHGQQGQIRAMVAESLKGIICQQLVPNKDDTGCCLAVEILLGSLAVSNLIKEGKTYQLKSTLQTNVKIGMCTMEQSYFDLYVDGKRSYEQTAPLIQTEDLKRQMQQIEAARQLGNGQAGMPSAAASENSPVPGVAAETPQKKKGWFGLGR